MNIIINKFNLVKRYTLPIELHEFIKKIDSIETKSLEELKKYVDEMTILERNILKCEVRLSGERYIDYRYIAVQLRYKLEELYDDKLLESVEDDYENKQLLASDIVQDVSSIKKISNFYYSLCDKLKNKKINLNKKVKIKIRKKKIPKIKPTLKKFDCSFYRKAKKKFMTMKRNYINFFSKKKNKYSKKIFKPIFVSLALALGISSAVKFSSVNTSENTTQSINTESFCSNDEKYNKDLAISNLINNIESNGQFYGLVKNEAELFDEMKFVLDNEVEKQSKEELLDKDSSIDFVDINMEESISEVDTDLLNDEVNGLENIEEEALAEDTIVEEEKEEIKIGQYISISEGSTFYGNMYDAYFDENQLNPSYSDEAMERKIKTVIVSNGSDLKNIKDNDSLDEYLNNGYEIIGCSVTNKYSINDTVEGYYRIDNVNVNEKILTF